METMRKVAFPFVVSSSLFILLVSCGGSGDPNHAGDQVAVVQGTDSVSGPAGSIPPGIVDPENGSGCEGASTNLICLAVKYVVFQDSSGTPVVSETEARFLIDEINAIWKQCGIQFSLEKYLSIDPYEYGLAYRTANFEDLAKIREIFAESRTLLVVTTGSWNRSGSLGSTGANAWTNLPGNDLYGAILESEVGENENIIAHELGHYLNLLHVTDSYALMNPVIYSNSLNIYDSQCSTARSAALYFWQNMLRS